ncbi:MAG: nucleoside phosphorylase [Candidatus Thermoplasmatota archaeon]
MPDEDREILTPLMGLKRRAEHGGAQVAPGSVPSRALFTWGDPLFEIARQFTRARPTDLKAGVASLYRGTWGGEPITLVNPGMGAPAAALVADKLSACGVDAIVGIGFAGILHPLLSSGDIIVVERAIGEDGASRCYLDGLAPVPGLDESPSPPDEVHADPAVRKAIELALAEEHASYQCGTTWTTDAPYRETVKKARSFRARGAHCVEMETAALLAVAKRRGIRAGAALVLSDSLCRVAPLDAPQSENLIDGLDWTWTPAPSGSLDLQVQALVRAALPVVAGPLIASTEAAHAH